MVNKIQLRRGTNAEREAVILDSGEPGWTTDTKDLYIGDGETLGGNLVTGVKAATFVVAASDSLHKERADYVCDGVADQVEIQAAIGALPDSGGGITLLEGEYTLTTKINLVSNLIFSGQGYGTLLKVANGDANRFNILDAFNVDNLIVKNLRVDGNKANVGDDNLFWNQVGVHFDRVNHGHIEKVWSVNNKSCNFRFGAACESGDEFLPCTNCVISNCVSTGSNRHGICVYPAEETEIVDNVFSDNVQMGVIFRQSENCLCRGNIITNNNREGIRSYDYTTYVSIIGNLITNNNEDGIYLAGRWHMVVNNQITSNGYVGVHLYGQNRNIINGNIIKVNNRQGLIVDSSDNNTIVGNYIAGNSQETDNAFDGIVISGNSEYNIITGNTVYHEYQSKRHRYGIKLEGGADSTLLAHNMLQSSGKTAVLLDEGVKTRIFDTYSDLFMDVLAVSAIYIRADEDLSENIPNTFTIDAQPDVPRTLSGHFDSHAQITAYTIVITGTDAKGQTVTETFTEAASPWDFETVNAYATITSIIMTARTGTGAGDTMDIGITDVLGLSNIIYETGDVFKIKKNNANAVVAAAQVNTTYDTYDMSVIGLAATNDFTIWCKSNLNIIS